MPSYIKKRGNRYSYYRRIPDVLRPRFQDRLHWVIPLDTDSRSEALVRARAMAAEHDKMLREAKGQTEWDVHAPGLAGDYARKRTLNPTGGIIVPWLDEAEKINPQARLSVVYQRYQSERPNLAETTITRFDLFIKRFIEVCGDRDINKLTRSDIDRFKMIIRQLPARPPHDVRDMNLSDQITWMKRNAGVKAPISARTVNGHLTAIRTVLNFAHKQTDLIKNRDVWSNPAEGFAMQTESKVEDERRPFDESEVLCVFAPTYQQFAKTPDRYWLPLLLFFTGARLDELAQCRLDEVGWSKDGFFLSLKNLEDNDRTAKNRTSSRMTPLHNRLVELGFNEYVALLKQENGKMLFPGIEQELGNKRGYKISQAFIRYFRGLNDELNTKRLTTHSLRHTFRVYGFEDKNGDPMNQDFVKVFMGHHVDEVNLGVYGKKLYSLHDVLRRQVLDRMRFPQIDPGPWQPKSVKAGV